eukprot:sb/3476093/
MNTSPTTIHPLVQYIPLYNTSPTTYNTSPSTIHRIPWYNTWGGVVTVIILIVGILLLMRLERQKTTAINIHAAKLSFSLSLSTFLTLLHDFYLHINMFYIISLISDYWNIENGHELRKKF